MKFNVLHSARPNLGWVWGLGMVAAEVMVGVGVVVVVTVGRRVGSSSLDGRKGGESGTRGIWYCCWGGYDCSGAGGGGCMLGGGRGMVSREEPGGRGFSRGCVCGLSVGCWGVAGVGGSLVTW